jgi:hypothetical protein
VCVKESVQSKILTFVLNICVYCVGKELFGVPMQVGWGRLPRGRRMSPSLPVLLSLSLSFLRGFTQNYSTKFIDANEFLHIIFLQVVTGYLHFCTQNIFLYAAKGVIPPPWIQSSSSSSSTAPSTTNSSLPSSVGTIQNQIVNSVTLRNVLCTSSH